MSAKNSLHTKVGKPQISFAMACYNAQPFLGEAIQSALDQTDVSIEVLVVDDGSSDNSLNEAREFARQDPRVRVFETPTNSGPAGARNMALQNMRGDWFAILDSDDIIEAGRSARLLALAEETQADLIADNLTVFGEGMEPHPFFTSQEFASDRTISIDDYFNHSQLFAAHPALGFLKPMIRASSLRQHQIQYNEELRIGEDDELIVRLLNAESKYYLSSSNEYKYRKHGNSISHRLSVENAERMLDAERSIRDMLTPAKANLRSYKQRFSSIERGLAFVQSVDQIKSKQWGAAISTLAKHPSAVALYRMPLEAALKRLIRKK